MFPRKIPLLERTTNRVINTYKIPSLRYVVVGKLAEPEILDRVFSGIIPLPLRVRSSRLRFTREPVRLSLNHGFLATKYQAQVTLVIVGKLAEPEILDQYFSGSSFCLCARPIVVALRFTRAPV